MKKFLSVLLAVALCAGLIGCGSSDPQKILEKAMLNDTDIQEMDMSVKMDMLMSYGGEEIDTKSDLHLKYNNMNSEDIIVSVDGTMSMFGESYDITSYYVDDYMYMDMLDMKVKTKMGLEEAMEQMGVDSKPMDIEIDIIKDLNMTKEGDNRVFTFDYDLEAYESVLDDVLQSGTLGDMAAVFEENQIDIRTMSGGATVTKGGQLAEVSLYLDMSVEAEGDVVDMKIDMSYTINNPGQKVVIDLPDLSEFEEY